MTLIELVVSLAIIVLMTGVILGGLTSGYQLEQRNAARKLALTYEQLQSEAILRNRTFRVVYDLTDQSWYVEQGDPNALVFSDPDARSEFEEKEDEVLEKMTPEEVALYRKLQGFSQVQTVGLQKLPARTVFRSVYTPQYEEPVFPEDRDKDTPGHLLVYSYVFANGQSEFTVVQIVDAEDDEEGFTITVDPLAGRVEMQGELIDHHDKWGFLPDDGPDLAN